MKSSRFPDVNVWLALTHSRHVHQVAAAQWFDSAADASLFFCRFTQLVFQAATLRPRPAAKLWADAYGAAFAEIAGLSLVTFDRGFPRLDGLDVELLSGRV